MKKFTVSGCITKLILTLIVILGFVYGFSILFPRAYNVLEAKALGIENDTAVVVVEKTDSVPRKMIQEKGYDLAIKLEQENGCYLIPVKLNGIPMKMLLDTGATSLSISPIEYEFLRRQKLLNDSSVEEIQCSTANGMAKGYKFTLSSLDIGGEIIKDVECVVMSNSDAPSLLGMNVLRKFGNVHIDYNKNLLILKE